MPPSEHDTNLLIQQLQYLDGDGRGDVRTAAMVALVKIGDAAILPLRTALGTPNWYVRLGASEALRLIGPAAVGPLCEALRDRDWSVRFLAAETLGKIGEVSAIGPISGLLKDKEWYVRSHAAEALGNIRDGAAVGPLCGLLRDQSLRIDASEALWKIGAEKTLPRAVLITPLLNGQQRHEALRALRKIRYQADRDEPLLCDRLRDIHGFCEASLSDPETEHGAREVLQYLKGTALLRSSEKDRTAEDRKLVHPASALGAEEESLLRPSVPPSEPPTAPSKKRRWFRR